MNTQLKEANRSLGALCQEIAGGREGGGGAPGDAAILRPLPGVDRVALATLLSEASEPLDRRDHDALRNLCGAAPVTRRNGKRTVVTMRRAAHVRLRLAFYHWSRVAIQRDTASRSKYTEFRRCSIRTHARSAAWPTACWPWSAPCSGPARS